MRNNLSKIIEQAWAVLTDYATYDFQSYFLPEYHGFNAKLLQSGIDADSIQIDAEVVLNAFPQCFDLGPAFPAKDDYFDDDAAYNVEQATLAAYMDANPRLATWLAFREDCGGEITTDQVVMRLQSLLHLDERDATKLLAYALDNRLTHLIPCLAIDDSEEECARTLFELWQASKPKQA